MYKAVNEKKQYLLDKYYDATGGLDTVYKCYSNKKQVAWNDCLNSLSGINILGALRCLNGNTYTFTAAAIIEIDGKVMLRVFFPSRQEDIELCEK